MSTNNAMLYVRFGTGRFRSLKPSAAKPGRRARSLEPVTQNLLHEATGVIWLPMDDMEEEKTEKAAAEKPGKKDISAEMKSGEPNNPGSEGSSPEQASLF